MRVRRGVLAVLGTVALVAVAAPAVAEPVTNFEMPFPCGEQWTGTTRSSHSPSSRAIDWNRADDVNDPVVASAAGVITVADKVNDSGYGRWVTIDHGNNERTIYAHLSSVTVSVGQRVDQGQQVGTLGTTGNSTGPHLHFEERSGSTVLWPFLHGAKFVFGTTPTSKNCVEVPMAVDWNGDGIAEPTRLPTRRPGRVPHLPPRRHADPAHLRRRHRRPGPRRLGRQRQREPGRPQPHDQDVLDEDRAASSPSWSSAWPPTSRSPATGTATGGGRPGSGAPPTASSSSAPPTGRSSGSPSATPTTCR